MNAEKLSIEEGRFLVKLARRAVEEYLSSARIITPPPETPLRLWEKRGVFVTIERIVVDPESRRADRILRGCIGYPEPVYPLVEGDIRAAIAAATQDPRFPPLTLREMKDVIFEVSVLTPPRRVEYRDPEELLDKIKVGRDGIIIESGYARGLLLPQVPVEYDWNVEEYLKNACLKAGLSEDAWREGRVNVYVFQAQIFIEVTPGGEVIERELWA